MAPETYVEVLWTGGYDSTFRVAQLSMLPVTIQPVYCSDRRESEGIELGAIEKITAMLNSRPATRATILPLEVVDQNERVESAEISAAYRRLLSRHYFGAQYDWLARFAQDHPGIELSIHQDDKAMGLIHKYGKLKKINCPVLGENFVLDVENASGDLVTLFQYFHLPLAYQTKLDMRRQYRAWGLEDVMEATWFCFSPVGGQPCGTCNPCVYSIEEGMRERFPAAALRRYRQKKLLAPLLRLKSRVVRTLRSL